MTVDPTFCLGEFECTPITYRHLLVVTQRNKTSTVFIGPILIHYRKNFASYSLLHIWCLRHELHCLGQMVKKLSLMHLFMSSDLQFSIARYILAIMLWRIENSQKVWSRRLQMTCLASRWCLHTAEDESEEVFYQKLEEKLVMEKDRKWPPWLFCWLLMIGFVSISAIPSSLECWEKMLVRCTPSPFTTNASESLNAVLKRKVNYKRNELPDFVNHLKEWTNSSMNLNVLS